MIEDFKSALDAAGLSTKDRIASDGRLHRVHIEGDKPGSRNGWYLLYGDGLPAGAFGSWKTGFKGSWCAKADRQMTPAERSEFARRMEEARAAREAEERVRREQAQHKAMMIFSQAPPAPDNHPYLMRKRIKGHGALIYNKALVIPMRDASGALHSLQFIDADGDKRFLSGGRKKGCFYLIGEPCGTLCIAEGYATAASIYERTGHATACAFDAGNLLTVAKALKAKYPAMIFKLCADNDCKTQDNPGLTRAREAALAIGGLLAVPPPPFNDFNDFYNGAIQ
jgi:putative DNA primase/helicase